MARSILQSSIAVLILAFDIFVWLTFVTVPPPNPWMMGETAFTRILITYGIAVIGAIVVSSAAPVIDWRLNRNLYRWLSLPSVAFLIILLYRAWFGLPLSIG